MDTSKLKKFAQYARRSLIEQVQSKLKLVLAEDSAARREYPHAVKELEAKQKEFGDDKLLIEQVAYTWFNRFCALRFMDANQYNRIMVVSPIAGQFQPEILAEAKAGHLDDSVFDAKSRDKIRGLLSGAIPSRDGQAEAYRLIIVAMCNAYHRLMPYLFERIEDYTELLMPEDLLSGNSILAYTREAMTPDNCESVESIGWLYQFYISEKKDQVFEGLKKNKKITPENIPAATQLFTPHWIVKYLVENSLGRLWMLNNPSSKVIEQMEYYIKPVEEESDFLKISTPEELKICDPAAGSGHMLTYAYDLLYAIYLDANYDPVDIPELILTKNLYGIEIDERAAELAAFALSMKAMKGNPFDDSNNRRRFFRNPIKPNICRLEKVEIDDADLEAYIEFAGNELFTPDVLATLKEFEEADNFGSLIQPTLKDPTKLFEKLTSKDAQVDLFLKDTHESILKILKQAKFLSPIYQVVIANPPYMGLRGMNQRLAKWANEVYPRSKYDLFSMFIERCFKLALSKANLAMITMHSWMFLTSYERMRVSLIREKTLLTMAHLGSRGFDSFGGEVVQTTAFVFSNDKNLEYLGEYLDLTSGKSESEKSNHFRKCLKTGASRYRVKGSDLKAVPGSPYAYWVTENVRNIFSEYKSVGSVADTRQGMATSNNALFVREWFEVDTKNTCRDAVDRKSASLRNEKWFPFIKGGGFRKWYGNLEHVVNWYKDGEEILTYASELYGSPTRTIKSIGRYFQENIGWSRISTGKLSLRYFPAGCIFSDAGSCIFFDEKNYKNQVLAQLNSSITMLFAKTLSPTLTFEAGQIAKYPFLKTEKSVDELVNSLVDIHKYDWDSEETSMDFKLPRILENNENETLLSGLFDSLNVKQKCIIDEVSLKEKQLNELFAREFNLENEISYHVPLEEITLSCNPYYRFGSNLSEESLNSRLKYETLKELISYAIGCLFGRYSIDKKGLILSNQGDSLDEYLNEIPSPSFMPDEDNVIPIIDFEGDWFEDDITERFKEFLKITFGEKNFTENLAFIEEAIGKDIKKYFVKDFYADHVKRYKKRPIYWMFSSPKGSFNALIYMHRYQPDTVSIVLNDYLREFRTKLEARKESYEQVEISASASQKDKTNAIKAISKINKVLEEINDYEHDVLYPLAGEKIEIDLDDGVKHNYPLFGKALKKVTGLS
ncbi:BREX-1 system adenine-specific DNA-methyltransferase PglX [Pseudoalteromonas maricaloris]|uniref:BREX-1 system adenine-specific DNA-methyltransferase PglX n=1 Tax=Pseudoalteromonas maricaloris TaxID=184924 RepID=UPI00029AADEE|nr:BREX-1 system adenine-specific DNA-methyltransferase PglX [Pseudoalteromonas flavipulchra]